MLSPESDIDELTMMRCSSCGQATIYARWRCPACGGEQFVTVKAPKEGVVYSWTKLFRAPRAPFRAHVPYYLAMVEIAEGVRCLAWAPGTPGHAPEIGAAVVLRMETGPEERPILTFEPARKERSG